MTCHSGARTLCPHWNATYRKDQHREVPCTVCGKMVVKNGPGLKRRVVCSDRCRYFLTFGHDIAEHRELVGPVVRRKPSRQSAPVSDAILRFVAGFCEWCSTSYVFDLRITGTVARYCSVGCARRSHQMRRRGREHSASGIYTWSEVIRIYLAIGGCAYCGERTDDMQPDHVIPLSRGGSNSITNIVPSCGPCNADKRDLYLHEWYADRERRGLAPRILDPRINHLTDAYLLALTA